MSKKWLDTPCFKARPATVDTEAGIIRGVKVCTEGEAKGHGVFLDSDFVETVATQGAATKRGLKARFGHPNMCSESLGTFVGRFMNFSTGTTTREDGTSAACCLADLHLSESAKDSPSGDLYAYIVSMAENEADMFGTSIVFAQGNRYRRDKAGGKIYPRRQDGGWNDEYDKAGGPDFIECKTLIACDCVDDPAANDGLFSADASATVAGQITEFLDLHPQIFQILEESPEVIEAVANYGDKFDEFLSRYRAYRAKQTREVEEMKDEEISPTPPNDQQPDKLSAVTAPPAEVKAEVEAALKADRKRQAEIRELGRRFGFDAEAETFANSDQTLAEFQAHILAKSPDSWKASLSIKNPAVQDSEDEQALASEGAAAVDKIKARRLARFGSK